MLPRLLVKLLLAGAWTMTLRRIQGLWVMPVIMVFIYLAGFYKTWVLIGKAPLFFLSNPWPFLRHVHVPLVIMSSLLVGAIGFMIAWLWRLWSPNSYKRWGPVAGLLLGVLAAIFL